jgi:hypothetical protein
MGEWMYRRSFSFTAALAEDEWSALRPGQFTPGERASVIDWIGGWVDPEPVWTFGEENILDPTATPISDPSVVQPVASRYNNYVIPASRTCLGENKNLGSGSRGG